MDWNLALFGPLNAESIEQHLNFAVRCKPNCAIFHHLEQESENYGLPAKCMGHFLLATWFRIAHQLRRFSQVQMA